MTMYQSIRAEVRLIKQKCSAEAGKLQQEWRKPGQEKPQGDHQAAAMITTVGHPAAPEAPAAAVRVPVPATAVPARAPEAADN